MEFRGSGSTLKRGDEFIPVSHSVRTAKRLSEDRILLHFSPQFPTDLDQPPEFTLPTLERNILCVDTDLNIIWEIEEAPEPLPDDVFEIKYFDSIFEIYGDVWARNTNDNLYRVDMETGELLETIPRTTLPFDGHRKEHPLPVKKVLTFEDCIVALFDTKDDRVIQTYPDTTSSGRRDYTKMPMGKQNINAYNRSDGTLRWQVEPIPPSEKLTDNECFSSIGYKAERYGLCAGNNKGYLWPLDIETGELGERRFTK